MILGLNGCMIKMIRLGDMGFPKFMDFDLIMVITSINLYNISFEYGNCIVELAFETLHYIIG